MRPVQGRRGLVPVPDARLSRFVHLHVHSPYSFLDGASPVERLLRKAKDLGMTAMALTDHNCLTGAVRFYDKAREMGIKPIVGAEVDVEGYHVTLLAQDLTGYSNLCHLLSEAHLSRPVNLPMATGDMLAKCSDGLIALSGCSKGKIPSLVAKGRSAEAREAVHFYKGVYPGRFYIELAYHPSSSGKHLVHRLAELAGETSTPVVATNDVHYAEMEEYAAHELLTAIRLIVPVDQLPGPRTVEQYLKSPAEMASLFRDVPEAVSNTLDIAERCNLDLPLGVPKFPSFQVPEGHSPQSYLRELALQGAMQVYGHNLDIISERLEHELRVIRLLGFETYFLVVWDIARFAREKGIRFQCRGSAVNSLVVHCLGISNVDPLAHDLLRALHARGPPRDAGHRHRLPAQAA